MSGLSDATGARIGEARSHVFRVNYSCRSATITLAGRQRCGFWSLGDRERAGGFALVRSVTDLAFRPERVPKGRA